MIDLSKFVGITQVIKKNEQISKKYMVVEENIDLKALMTEKEMLEYMLNTPEPREEELIELGKNQHPYYQDKTWIKIRIDEIDKLLGK